MTAIDHPHAHPHLPQPTRWHRNVVFGAIGTAIVLGWIGDAFWASLVDRSPLTLLLLNAKPRYLILTVNELDPRVFYPVALVRLVITKPLLWLVGAWYGPRTVEWVAARYERTARLIRWVQRHFARFGWAIMLVTTTNAVCLLAGSVGYPLAGLLAYAVIGTLIRLVLIDLLGRVLSDQIDWFIGWVIDHRIQVIIASIVVVVVGIAWQRRHGGSALDELASLEDAVEHEVADELDAADGASEETR